MKGPDLTKRTGTGTACTRRRAEDKSQRNEVGRIVNCRVEEKKEKRRKTKVKGKTGFE